MERSRDDEIYALDRICERHPDVTKEDAIHAWRFCIKSMPRVGKEPEVRAGGKRACGQKSMPRVGKEPEEHVGIGYDAAGRLLEVVAIRNGAGAWLVKHAQTPPQERVKRELGFGRRRR